MAVILLSDKPVGTPQVGRANVVKDADEEKALVPEAHTVCTWYS